MTALAWLKAQQDSGGHASDMLEDLSLKELKILFSILKLSQKNLDDFLAKTNLTLD